MNVVLFPCGHAANESELKALEFLKSRLQSEPGGDNWILLANLPTFEPLSGYRSRFSSDEFGLVVRCAEEDAPRFESMLREAGAQEITREAA